MLTIHRSKGLEFPDRLPPVPLAARVHRRKRAAGLPRRRERRRVDDRRRRRRRPDIKRHRQLRANEQRGEDLRLLYVALTRTMHQATVWWAGAWESHHSALGRLLFAREADGAVPSEGSEVPEDDDVAARFEKLAATAPGRIAVERVEAPTGARWAGEPQPPVELEAGRFQRALDARWRRVSYSGIVAGRHEQAVATEPEVDVVDDELLATAPVADVTAESDAEEQRLRATPAALSAMPGGAEVGDLLHRVLEATDFASADLDAELARRLAEQQGRRHVDIGDTEAVIAGLAGAIETPLGPLVGELRLRDVATADRLDELAFELPLVGGDTPAGTLALSDLASLLESHLPADDPLAGYARPPARPAPRLGPARLPHRNARPRAPDPRRGRLSPLRARRLQEQLARRRGRGSQRLALPACRSRGGDAACALPAAGPALSRRAAPVSARTASRLRPRHDSSPASSTCSSAG